MKKIVAAIIIVLTLAGFVYAGAISSGTITVSNTAQSISSPSENAKKALITYEGGSVYFSIYTSATSSSGHLLYVGDSLILDNYHDIAKFNVILTSAGSSSTTTYVRYTLFD